MLPAQILTVNEVSAILHVHPSTIYRLLKNHELPAFKVGSDWRFNVEQIDGWRLRQTILPQRPRREPGN
jgi:excisionase family DNA binding protein